MDEQQRLNYLMWMKERGQTYLVPNNALAASLVSPVETPPAIAAASVPAAIPKAIGPSPSPPPSPAAATAALPQLKVIFYAPAALTSEELEMVTRIAGALSLKTDTFQVASAPSAQALIAAQKGCTIVMMGQEAVTSIEAQGIESEGRSVLIISHPGAMILDPQLKVSTWNTLQKLKATR